MASGIIVEEVVRNRAFHDPPQFVLRAALADGVPGRDFLETAAEVVPVVQLDQRPIADGRPGPITRELMRKFRDLVRS